MWEPWWVAVLINSPSFVSVRLCLPDELCFAHTFVSSPVPQPDVLCQCRAVLIKGKKFPLGAALLCVTVDCLRAVFSAKLLCYSLQKQEESFFFCNALPARTYYTHLHAVFVRYVCISAADRGSCCDALAVGSLAYFC